MLNQTPPKETELTDNQSKLATKTLNMKSNLILTLNKHN